MKTTKQNSGPAQDVLPPDRDPRGGNAQRHGILSEHVPPDEREAYAVHVQKMREATGAAGYLQERLADRAALALWRLDRVARYEAAQVSTAQRRALKEISEGTPYSAGGPASELWQAAARLARLTTEAVRADPAKGEAVAIEYETYAAQLETWAEGGSADGLSDDAASYLGDTLAAGLLDYEAKGADIVRAVMGRAPRKGEAALVEGDEWLYEPQHLPRLLTFAREYLGAEAAAHLLSLARVERGLAAQLRAALNEARAAEADVLALASMSAPQVLEKVTRYEAHLERVLYRALHDLEAARRESSGLDVTPPLRVSGSDLD